MSFLDKIENIQKKPEHSKKKIVIASTVFLTVLLVISWLSFANPLAPISGNPNGGSDTFSSLQGTATAAKPMLDQLKESLSQMKEYSDLLGEQAKPSAAPTTASEQETPVTEEEIATTEEEPTTPPEVLKYLENATINN